MAKPTGPKTVTMRVYASDVRRAVKALRSRNVHLSGRTAAYRYMRLVDLAESGAR